MKTLFTLFVLFFLSPVFASKVLFYSEYKKNTNSEIFIQHLKSVESGMSWMQVYNKQIGNNFVYCKPGKLNVSSDNLKDALDLYVETLKKQNYTSADIDKYPIEVLMLYGLIILFPCD